MIHTLERIALYVTALGLAGLMWAACEAGAGYPSLVALTVTAAVGLVGFIALGMEDAHDARGPNPVGAHRKVVRCAPWKIRKLPAFRTRRPNSTTRQCGCARHL